MNIKYAQNASATVMGLIVAAVAVLGAGGGYYYYTQNIAPKRVLADTASTLTDAQKLRSFRYEGTVEGSYDVSFSRKESNQADSSDPQTFSSSFKGVFDRTDPETIEGKLSIQNQDTSAEEQTGSLNLRLRGPIMYVSMGGSEAESATSPLPQGQWLKIDTTNKQNLQQASGTLRAGPLSSLSNPNKTLSLNLSSEEKSQLKRALRENQFITVTNTYGKERVAGKTSHHYGYAFHKEKYIAFLKEAQSIVGKEHVSDKMISSSEEWVSNLDSLTGEIWISTDNKYPTRLTADITMKDQKSSMKDMSFQITLKEHNKDFTVKEPDSAQSIEEIFQSFFPDASQESFEQSGDTSSSQGPDEVPENFENFDQESLQSENTDDGLTEEEKKQLFEEYQGAE